MGSMERPIPPPPEDLMLLPRMLPPPLPPLPPRVLLQPPLLLPVPRSSRADELAGRVMFPGGGTAQGGANRSAVDSEPPCLAP
ncbi:MAG: hypothetical protein WDW38_003123 [Sanguina aurantia]